MTDPTPSDLTEAVARAIWTAPITGQPLGQECREWPITHTDALTETFAQADASIAAMRAAAPADDGEVARLRRDNAAMRRKLKELGVELISDVDGHLAALAPRSNLNSLQPSPRGA